MNPLDVIGWSMALVVAAIAISFAVSLVGALLCSVREALTDTRPGEDR